MTDTTDKKIVAVKRMEWVLIIISTLLLIVSLMTLVHVYTGYGIFTSPRSPHQPWRGYLRGTFQPDEIGDWMTFGFINRAFAIPDDYLKTKLNITDKKYPNMTISSWAKQSKLDSASLVGDIIKLIRNYQGSTPTPMMTSQ